MEEKQQCSGGTCKSKCKLCAVAPFILGLVLALTFGWWVFPDLLYSQKEQPVKFKHLSHVSPEGQNLECNTCHSFRPDGSFAGAPKLEKCVTCHSSVIGGSANEAAFVSQYVEKKKEVDWQIHQTQPDNVFFSHAAHAKENCLRCHTDWTEQDLCSRCHLPLEELDKGKPVKENMLTTYSSTTMKMWECEQCHAKLGHYQETNSNNACYTCHK